MILDQLERALMAIGDKVITASGGFKNTDSFEIDKKNVTNELVVKPRPKTPIPLRETRNSLNNLTKQAICELASERYGFDLNFRTEKKILITQFLTIQNQDS